MSACKTLLCASLSPFKCTLRPSPRTLSLSLCSLLHHPHAGTTRLSFSLLPSLSPYVRASNRIHAPGLRVTSRCCTSTQSAASVEAIDSTEEPHEDQSNDPVQHLLTSTEEVSRLMKMERKPLPEDGFAESEPQARWFPYLDRFKCGNGYLSSSEVIEAVGPCISEVRKERFRNVVRNRSYSVCLVVEGLCDFGNVSAAFRSADALGVQSVHVVSCDSNKRCKESC